MKSSIVYAALISVLVLISCSCNNSPTPGNLSMNSADSSQIKQQKIKQGNQLPDKNNKALKASANDHVNVVDSTAPILVLSSNPATVVNGVQKYYLWTTRNKFTCNGFWSASEKLVVDITGLSSIKLKYITSISIKLIDPLSLNHLPEQSPAKTGLNKIEKQLVGSWQFNGYCYNGWNWLAEVCFNKWNNQQSRTHEIDNGTLFQVSVSPDTLKFILQGSDESPRIYKRIKENSVKPEKKVSQEVTHFMDSLIKNGIDPGVERARALRDRMENPESFAVDKNYYGKAWSYDATVYEEFTKSPCYGKIGFSPWQKYEDLKKEYAECEKAYYKNLVIKIIVVTVLLVFLGLMLYFTIRKHRKKKGIDSGGINK